MKPKNLHFHQKTNVTVLFISNFTTHFIDVIVDLRAPSFKPGKKFYERVQWCFTDRIDPVSFLCFWVNDGTTQEIRFPAKFESKRMEIACSDETQPPVNCPDFVDIMKTFAVNHKIEEDDETILDDLMMWLGLVHTRSLR